jgi:glutamate--LysW ligase ArgX
VTLHVDLVVDVVRLEEQLLRKALERWARLRVVDLDREPIPIGGARVDSAVVRPISMYRAAYAAAGYEAARVFTVNSSETIIYAGDKMLTYTRMRAHRLPVPRAYYASTPEAAVKAAEELGYPVVVKAPVGSWGRLVSRARRPEKVEQIARLRRALPCSQQRAMIVR